MVPVTNRDGSAARTATEEDWVDASRDAVHKSDLRLVVTSVTVKPLDYKDARGKKARTREKYLQIALRLSNVAINRTVDYASWGEFGRAGDGRGPRLYDNLGKPYAVKVLDPGTEATGHVASARIGPLKAVKDLLAFEPPPPGIEYLRLELPCAAFGATDKFQLQIPKRMVVYP
jgi:hypothetical protein